MILMCPSFTTWHFRTRLAEISTMHCGCVLAAMYGRQGRLSISVQALGYLDTDCNLKIRKFITHGKMNVLCTSLC